MKSDRIESLGFYFATPFLKKDLPMVYFPFQMIDTEFIVKRSDTGSELRSKLKFFIPLFFIKNINYFGDIGYYYFLKKISPENDIDRGYPIFPADRCYDDVKPYPEIYLLQYESEKVGIELISTEFHIIDKSIHMIPFYKNETDYYDSYLFWKYPSGALI